MTTIEFKKTSNVFVNAGIVALYRYIEKYKRQYPEKYEVTQNLMDSRLSIECSKLLEMLEDVYYFMGNEIYDTATKKQIDEAKENKANFYYDTVNDKFVSFPKMNTRGLTHLLTNNAQGVTRNEENSTKIEQLKKTNSELARKIEVFFEENNLKLLSKVYFNEPYTKLTRLEFKTEYLLNGNETCPIINESFKKLVEGKNISPFIGGMSNFNTHLSSSDRKISWKALFLIRFSPALVFFDYKNGTDTLSCNFINSNNLQNINTLNDYELYKSVNELQDNGYNSNFKYVKFTYTKIDSEESEFDTSKDCVSSSETSMLLLYTFYTRHFKNEIAKHKEDNTEYNPFADHPIAKIPISISSFKADKFASTMRPNEFEEYNDVKFIFRFIFILEEKEKIDFKHLWSGLKIKTPKSQAKKFDGRIDERKLRSEIFSKILKRKSITEQIEHLFYTSFNHKIDGFNTGYSYSEPKKGFV